MGERGGYPPLYSEKKMRVDHEIKISWSKCGSVVLVLSKISNFERRYNYCGQTTEHIVSKKTNQ